MSVIKPALLSKMRRGSEEYFRHLERYLEQSYRQSGSTIGQLDDENMPAVATAQTSADTAQTTGDNAAAYRTTDTPTFIWNTDADTAAWPADDTRDLTIAWETKAGVAIADRVLKGSFTQSGATIAITAVSNSETAAGVSTAYALTGDGTKSVRATVTLTFADASTVVGSLSWSAQDLNTAGGTPATGGGK